MNKIEALNEKALESAVLAHDKEEAAMRDYPAQAAELRRVAAQLAAENDNARNDARRVA